MKTTLSLRGLRHQALRAAQVIGLVQPRDGDQGLSPDDISRAECQALRQILLLTQAEAAAWLSNPPVSERAWQYWEAGRRAVPTDVAQNLRDACRKREEMLADALDSIQKTQGQLPIAVWYAKADDWKWTFRDLGLEWKLHNSVLAELASRNLVRLVGFDVAAYVAWSEALPAITSAGEMARHVQWAAETQSGTSAGG